MIIVGIDAHSGPHTAAAIDEQGRLLDTLEVTAGPTGLEQLSEWLARWEQPRLVAIEKARGYGLPLARRLLIGGEELLDVPAALPAEGRRGSGQRGKHDEGDALVIARVALRDQAPLPRLDAGVLDDELKLLTDARAQLIIESGRWRNRAHACSEPPPPATRPAPGRSPRQVPS